MNSSFRISWREPPLSATDRATECSFGCWFSFHDASSVFTWRATPILICQIYIGMTACSCRSATDRNSIASLLFPECVIISVVPDSEFSFACVAVAFGGMGVSAINLLSLETLRLVSISCNLSTIVENSGRFAGSWSQHWCMSSLHPLGVLVSCSDTTDGLPVSTAQKISSRVNPGQGGAMLTISDIMILHSTQSILASVNIITYIPETVLIDMTAVLRKTNTGGLECIAKFWSHIRRYKGNTTMLKCCDNANLMEL